LEKKQRKAEFFSHRAALLKRRATNELEGAPLKKRFKRDSGHQEVMSGNEDAQGAPEELPKELEEVARFPEPRTALERLASRQAKVVKTVRSQAETDEHQEIAWLEHKLGISGKVSKSSIFKEDGLEGRLPKVIS
jgi:hypothetical protein